MPDLSPTPPPQLHLNKVTARGAKHIVRNDNANLHVKTHKERTRKTISKEGLEYYLARAIQIISITELCLPTPYPTPDGIWHCTRDGEELLLYNWINNHDPTDWRETNQEIMNGTVYSRYLDCLRLIANVKAKFIDAAIGGSNNWDLRYHFYRARYVIRDIKAIDSDIIVQAYVAEDITQAALNEATKERNAHDQGNVIPDWVWLAFPFNADGTPNNRRMPPDEVGFDPKRMVFPGTWNDISGHPNIKNTETQMWFYYLGCQYIDAGCESISFSQPQILNHYRPDSIDEDPSFATDPYYWNILFEKLRQHADQQPNVRFLLIAGDTMGMRDEATGRLAFDIHSYELRPCEYPYYPSVSLPPNGGLVYLSKESCKDTIPDTNLWGQSLGGISPSGWYCIENPVQAFFDNTEYETNHIWGTIHQPPSCCYLPYGWDELTWYAMQDEHTRNVWQKYACYATKCLDPNVYFSFPVRRRLTNLQVYFYANNNLHASLPDPFLEVPVTSSQWSPNPANNLIKYPDRQVMLAPANTNASYAFKTEDVIKLLIHEADSPNAPDDWVHHSFTDEEVYDHFIQANAYSDLVFVGDDKMYYIGADQKIYGYVKDPAKPGVWFTVSPSAAYPNHMYAQTDLVASPDGSRLLFIGTDGFIYAFNILGIYQYTFEDFMKWEMQQVQHIKALWNLTYATPYKIYYIAQEADGARRVHGFIKENNVWKTVSPTWAAQLFYGQSVLFQVAAAGALTYDANTQRLYYVGIGGLYYFSIIDDWRYLYNICNGNAILNTHNLQIISKLAIAGNKIFYVALENNTFRRVYCLVDNGNNNWGSQSPSWAAADPAHIPPGFQPIPLAQQVMPSPFGDSITVDGNGDTIAYLGEDNNIYYFHDFGNDIYTYNSMPSVANNMSPSLGIKFHGEKLFYITAFGDRKVHNYTFEKSYCRSPYIYDLFPAFPNFPNAY